MKAITIGAEYAFFVVHGDKRVETRSLPCSYRGPVAVHAAAKTFGKPGPIGDYEVARDSGGYLIRGESLAWPYRLPTGAIVAMVDLVDCVPIVDTWPENDGRHVLVPSGTKLTLYRGHPHHEPYETDDIANELPYGIYTPGRWALLLDNVRRVRRPVMAKGQQSVPWNVPEDVAAEVRAQLDGVDA